jgi:Ca2+/H+ antiporter
VTVLFIIGVFYVIPMLIVYALGYFSDNLDITKQGKIANLFPGISIFFLLLFILDLIFTLYSKYFEDKVNEIREKIQERKEKRMNEKERKIKIKMGIIRISPIDPYGEEDWEN